MKKGLIALVVAVGLAFSVAAFADKGLPVYKKGETVYVCSCGAGCDCLTVARKAGNCSCSKALEKTKIDKISGGTIYVKVKGKELTFPVKAKYACACGEGCNCGTVSQKPGKCACGNEMKKVE